MLTLVYSVSGLTYKENFNDKDFYYSYDSVGNILYNIDYSDAGGYNYYNFMKANDLENTLFSQNYTNDSIFLKSYEYQGNNKACYNQLYHNFNSTVSLKNLNFSINCYYEGTNSNGVPNKAFIIYFSEKYDDLVENKSQYPLCIFVGDNNNGNIYPCKSDYSVTINLNQDDCYFKKNTIDFSMNKYINDTGFNYFENLDRIKSFGFVLPSKTSNWNQAFPLDQKLKIFGYNLSVTSFNENNLPYVNFSVNKSICVNPNVSFQSVPLNIKTYDIENDTIYYGTSFSDNEIIFSTNYLGEMSLNNVFSYALINKRLTQDTNFINNYLNDTCPIDDFFSQIDIFSSPAIYGKTIQTPNKINNIASIVFDSTYCDITDKDALFFSYPNEKNIKYGKNRFRFYIDEKNENNTFYYCSADNNFNCVRSLKIHRNETTNKYDIYTNKHDIDITYPNEYITSLSINFSDNSDERFIGVEENINFVNNTIYYDFFDSKNSESDKNIIYTSDNYVISNDFTEVDGIKFYVVDTFKFYLSELLSYNLQKDFDWSTEKPKNISVYNSDTEYKVKLYVTDSIHKNYNEYNYFEKNIKLEKKEYCGTANNYIDLNYTDSLDYSPPNDDNIFFKLVWFFRLPRRIALNFGVLGVFEISIPLFLGYFMFEKYKNDSIDNNASIRNVFLSGGMFILIFLIMGLVKFATALVFILPSLYFLSLDFMNNKTD